MRALRTALALALIAGATVSLLDQTAFARTGGNGPGAAGGAAGGGSSGSSGAGGAGAGSNPNIGTPGVPVTGPLPVANVPPRHRVAVQPADPTNAGCFRQEALYDAYGYPVWSFHGVECYR